MILAPVNMANLDSNEVVVGGVIVDDDYGKDGCRYGPDFLHVHPYEPTD